MKLQSLINEEIYNMIKEVDANNYWYHGTPDVREIKERGFQPKTNVTSYITNPQEYVELQKNMKIARNNGDEKQYFELLNQAGNLDKKLTYKKPIYFTNSQAVARTYADEKRAFDYQNSVASIIKVTIDDNGKILTIPAYGESFRGIDIDIVRKALSENGIPDNIIDKYFNMFRNYINRNNQMSSETLSIIAQLLKFDIIDVVGVLDSYHGGNIKSTVRIVFDPKRITIVN